MENLELNGKFVRQQRLVRLIAHKLNSGPTKFYLLFEGLFIRLQIHEFCRVLHAFEFKVIMNVKSQQLLYIALKLIYMHLNIVFTRAQMDRSVSVLP